MTQLYTPKAEGSLIEGGAGNDFLMGQAGDDTINAGAGDDFTLGEGGNDIISGGDGMDFIDGGDGNDTLSGDAGDDVLYGWAGHDLMLGGSGVDAFDGGIGDDTMTGGAGQDHFQFDIGYNSSGADNWGHDVITDFNTAEDMLYVAVMAGDENAFSVTDTADGALVSYDNNGSVSTILLPGVLAADLTIQTDFSDPNASIGQEIVGNASSELLIGSDLDDTILGQGGNDTIDAGAGEDYAAGGDGDDLIYGGDDFDVLSGDAGNDTLYGDGGDDILYGWEGNDEMHGGTGVDAFDGGIGDDTMTGGAGQDHFQFDIGYNSSGADNWGHDVITDFDPTEDMLYVAVLNGDANAFSITDTAGGALISYDNDGSLSTILLQGVIAADVTVDTTF
ncbi:MAG: hypothetical protein HWE08_03340 [Alphaproteobacteria bacterium]|nr:hypothetical protein [Alphaproteobacteria bacterium]